MNTTAMQEPSAGAPSTHVAPAAGKISEMQRLYWSVQRELWENRYLYVAPLAVAALILVGFAFGVISLPEKLRAAALDPVKWHHMVWQPYTFAALLLMFTTFLAAMFYCLDALYGERRDRSVLFWKSLPVSDTTAVLAKASIPFLLVPLFTFALTVTTQALMLLLASARLMGTGLSVWSHVSFGQDSWVLFYHLLIGHGFWYAPIWGWLLLCSAWSRRTPYLWATLPLLAVGLVEKIAFNTSHFATWLGERFVGDPSVGRAAPAPAGSAETMAAMTPPLANFVSSPEFWLGLLLAAAFLAMAVRLRRSRPAI